MMIVLLRMKETIQNSVFALRTARGITQEGLADELSVSRQTVVAIEKGNYTPSVLLAMKIAKFFAVPVEKIFQIKHV